jgi:threonine dehydrogenase-like Zn-dependent dehydrogenase
MTEGFDVVLEMSAQPGGLQGMLGLMNHGGKVALFCAPARETAVTGSGVFKGLLLKASTAGEVRNVYKWDHAAKRQRAARPSPTASRRTYSQKRSSHALGRSGR